MFDKIRPIGNTIFYQRVDMAREIEESLTVLEIATIAGILIGLGTTIFAGLRGDDSGVSGDWKNAVRVLAIVFPALGAAVAAVAAVYVPREQFIRTSQALTNLQQLHAEVRTQLTQVQCPLDEEKTRQVDALLGGLAKKLADQRRETAAARLAATAGAIGLTARDSNLKSNLGTPRGPDPSAPPKANPEAVREPNRETPRNP